MAAQDVRDVAQVVVIVAGVLALAALGRRRGRRRGGRAGGQLAPSPARAGGQRAPRAGPALGGWLILALLDTARRRSGPDTTNSTTASPATAIPDHTRGEKAKPFAKSPMATPIFQNISIEPVR